MLSLGYCPPTSDNLTVGGLPSGAAVWTPDGSGGGTLVVDVPAGAACEGSVMNWGVGLQLTRSGCGKKLLIEVSGTSPRSGDDVSTITIYDQAAVKLEMVNTGGGDDCTAPGPWVVVSGSNPCEAKSRCGGATFRTAEIIISAISTFSAACTTTITVTMS